MRRYLAIAAFPVLLAIAAQGLSHVRDGLVALDGRFIGLDGYTHLLRAKQFVETGDWFDHRVHRGNPPEGDELYWPRPFDAVLLAGAAVLTPILGFDVALHAWGVFVSPVLHLISLFVLLWAARPLFDDRGLFYLGVLFAFQLFIIHMSSVARPDHHGFLALLFVWYVGAMLRLLAPGAGLKAALLTALPAVFSMWISLESLVITAASFLALGLAWIAVREDFAGKLAVFASALAAGFGLSLVAEHGPRGLSALHYDAPSAVHLALFALAAVAALTALAADRWLAAAGTRSVRVLVSALGGGFVVAAMWILLPKFFQGPLAEVDSDAVALWFNDIAEYAPLIDFTRPRQTLPQFIFHLGLAFLAVPFLVQRAATGRGAERRAWLWLLLLSLCYVPLAIVQQRWANFAQYVLVIPYTGLLLALIDKLGERAPLVQAAGRAGLVVLFLFGFPLIGGLLFQPRQVASAGVACPLTEMSRWIDAEPALNDRTRRILSFINFGPELLYRTRHEVIATPNHRNARSILDAIQALGRLSPEKARAIIERRGVDLVLVCRGTEEATDYRRGNGGDTLFRAMEAGAAPDWLTPIALPEALAESFLLFEVRR